MTTNLALKLDGETVRRTDEQGWRWYGDKISVTTILENAVANPSLTNWYKNNSAAKIEKVKSATASFGTDGHKYFEQVLLGTLGEVPESHQIHVENFKKWVGEHAVTAIQCEVPLISEKYGVAGTADFIGQIDGEITLADWKTGTRYRITNGWQMGFYRRAAIESGLVDESCGLMGVQIDRNTAEIKTFKYQHLEFVEHAFLCALEVFKALHFNKLAKLEWPWLHKQSVGVIL